MRRAVVGALAATVLGWPATPAFGDVVHWHGDTVVTGETCGWRFVQTNTWGEDHTDWAGVIDGGPIAGVNLAGDQPVVTLTCSLHFGDYPTHEDVPVMSVTGSGAVVAVIPPTPVTVTDPAATGQLAVCAKVTLEYAGGGTADLYLDSWSGDLSTDPSVPCGSRTCPTWGCGEPFPFWVIDEVYEETDAALCDPLQDGPDEPGVVETRPDGDVYVLGTWVWDCPPYGG